MKPRNFRAFEADKKAIARADREGYIQVAIVQPPGCLARAEALAGRLAWAGAWFALGMVVGLWLK